MSSDDAVFDPEIHATDKDGNPSLNKDGSFRKKRKDAGASASKPAAAPSRSRGSRTAGPGAQRAKYHKSVSDFLALPVAGLSMTDPVLGYAATEVAPMWSDVLADLAVEQPRLAAMLERLGGFGAAGAVLTVGALTFVQFGTLLGKVPPHVGKMMGCKSREEIEAILQARGEKLAAQRPAPEAPVQHDRAQAPTPRVMARV